MNGVSEITMPVEEAEAAFKEYRAAFMESHCRRDKLIVEMHRELKKGRSIINLHDAIHGAGFDALKLPKLAIVRAHCPRVFFYDNFDEMYFCEAESMRYENRGKRILVPKLERGYVGRKHTWYRAMTPIIPPHLRPADSLENYHILWEAEWTPIPPRDPILLKHISGPMYAVLAHWDLTEVERAALAVTAAN